MAAQKKWKGGSKPWSSRGSKGWCRVSGSNALPPHRQRRWEFKWALNSSFSVLQD